MADLFARLAAVATDTGPLAAPRPLARFEEGGWTEVDDTVDAIPSERPATRPAGVLGGEPHSEHTWHVDHHTQRIDHHTDHMQYDTQHVEHTQHVDHVDRVERLDRVEHVDRVERVERVEQLQHLQQAARVEHDERVEHHITEIEVPVAADPPVRPPDPMAALFTWMDQPEPEVPQDLPPPAGITVSIGRLELRTLSPQRTPDTALTFAGPTLDDFLRGAS